MPAWILVLSLLLPSCGPGQAPPPAPDPASPPGPSAAQAPDRLSQTVRKKGRALEVRARGCEHVQPNDHVDFLGVIADPKTQQPAALTLVQNVIVLAKGVQGSLWVLVLPEEAEVLALAQHLGGLTALLRNPEGIDVREAPGRTSVETLFTGERVRALRTRRTRTIQVIRHAGAGLPAPASHPPELAASVERYQDHGVNPWTSTYLDRLSTFAADVDTGAYTLARRKLNEGKLPPPAAVRTEEFVNYFRYHYPGPDRKDGAPFGVALEAAPSPFDQKRVLLRVGVQTQRPKARARRPVHLTFLVDTSGSMATEGKLGLVQRSLRFLVDQLSPGDTVAIATYAGFTQELLPPTGMEKRAEIHAAIEGLTAGGSTAMQSGLELAYDLAWRSFKPGEVNRVLLLSDGDANVGATRHGDMLQSIQYYADRGVTLSTVGFGDGNYKDDTMEQLADKGNGNYTYVDDFSQAKRVFGENLLGTLEVVAQDVKLQVEFEPAAVARYRLLGYENRDIADHDFRNDAVDAGEIGAGHAVTALYELELRDPARDWGVVRVRWKEPAVNPNASSRANEREFPIEPTVLAASFEASSLDLQRAVMAAGLAEHLRHAPGRETWALATLRNLAQGVARRSKGKATADDDELLGLFEIVAQLEAEKTAALVP